MSRSFWINFLDRYERRPHDRPGKNACIIMIIFLIFVLVLIYIGPLFLSTPWFGIVFSVLLAGVLIFGFITLKVYQADRRRRQAFRERAYRQHQYPARYPFSGRRLDRDSDQEESASLQARIAELEDQLAIVKQQRSSMVSDVPEAVVTVKIGDREKAPELKTDVLQREQRLLQEELKAEKAAIDVLLIALEEAMARGAISEEEYLRKQKKYQKELRSLDKKLNSLD
ncbi:MAG: hypothetical protein ACFE8O_05810 [Candidatus Hermodarchaeota archaeon]